MTVNPDLFRGSNDPDSWRLLVEAMNAEFKAVDMDAARRRPTAALAEKDAETERNKATEGARSALQSAINYRWSGYRLHYTLGQLDTDVMILMAERSVVGWHDLFNAKAAFGTAEDLVKIQAQALLFNTAIVPTNALPSATKPLALATGLRFEGNLETTEQLFKMGADPGYDNNGALFNSVVEAGRPDIGRLFAKYGQNGLLNVDQWVNSAKAYRKLKLYEDLRKIQWEFGRFTVVDNETLVENKVLPDSMGSLKVIFDFSARRVTEVMELASPVKQTTTKDFTFDDYGQNAIERARDKLVELGATPSGIDIGLRGKSKPAIAKPAAQRGLSAPSAG